MNKRMSLTDYFKWAVAVVLTLTAIVMNQVYNAEPLSLRLIVGLVVAGLVGGIAFQTSQGREALAFLSASKQEMRKVVWPSRREAVQTTLIVIAMVLASSIILWAFDSFLLWVVGTLTGQRG